MTAKSSTVDLRITPPQVIEDALDRTKLFARLDGERNRIIYVVAPTGFGKTVFASQWLSKVSDRDGLGVWIEVDPYESELGFITTALHAFRRSIKGFATWFDLESLTSMDSALANLDRLIDEIGKIKSEIGIVIDNSDHFGVSSSAIANRFVSRMPQNVTIMVIREKSPIASSLGTIGVNDFSIVNVDDLRFDSRDVIQLSSGRLSEAEGEKIIELTEGWPIATRIVIENVNRFDLGNQGFNLAQMGSISSVIRQAIAQLEERELQVLRKLSLITRITNQVAQEVADDEVAPMILAKLSADSFFLTRIISNPTVYEMNQLIRSALHDDLSNDVDLYREIHSRTFDALYRNGAKDQAFELLARSGQESMIKELISDKQVLAEVTHQIRDAIYRNDLANLRSWVSIVPFLEGESKNLSFALDFYLKFLSSDYDQAKALLTERLSTPSGNDGFDAVRNSSKRLQALVDFARGDFTSSTATAFEALQGFEKNSSAEENRYVSYSSFLRFGAVSAFFSEDLEKIRLIDEHMENSLRPDPTSHFQMNALLIKTIRAYAEGRYRLAESFALAAISYSDQHKVQGIFTPFEAYFAMFQIKSEQCRPEEAEKYYRIACTEARRIRLLPWIVMLQGRHAIATIRNGHFSEGLADFQSMMIEMPSVSPYEIETINDKHEMIIHHLVDSPVRKEQIRARVPKNQTAKLYEAQAQLNRNSTEFEKLIAGFDMSMPRESLNAYVFWVIRNFDYPPKAREYLAKAIEVAQENGFYQYFLIQCDEFNAFLISASTEMPSLFLERLAKDASERLSKKMTSSDALPVPLTKREADILRHLSSDQPLSKIAGNLNITKNTMKTHLRHLYRKLGASDRRDAVEKGKALLSL